MPGRKPVVAPFPDHGTPENDSKEPSHVKDVLKR